MQCAEFEIRLCEYLDGTLEQAAHRELEQHAAQCRLCAELLSDSAALRGFLEGVPAVEAPPELVTTILFRTQKSRASLWLSAGGWRRWLGPLLQPRFVMGMAMTILSLSMLSRVAGVKIRQLEAADLNPVSIWRGIDNQAHRLWDRGAKFYQNVRFIYEIMAQLRAFEAEEEQVRQAEPRGSETPTDSPAGTSRAPEQRRIEPSPGGPR